MNCKFDKELIQNYIDNTIEPLELIVLKEHIAVCQDCKFELDLMSKLDSSMYDYFNNLPSQEMLDEYSTSVLDNCYESTKSKRFMSGISKVWQINKMVVSNATMYTSYLPGNKLAVNIAKKTRNGMNKAVKDYMKMNFKRLIVGAFK